MLQYHVAEFTLFKDYPTLPLIADC